MDWIITLWQASPWLFTSYYTVIGILILCGIVYFDFATPADIWEEFKQVIPGGRARVHKKLQTQIIGYLGEVAIYRDKDSIQWYMRPYRIYVLCIWLYILVPIFFWPLLIVAIIGIMYFNVLCHISMEAWQKLKKLK